MTKRQYTFKYGIVFTLCMCFVLAFVIFSTGAWLTSSQNTSGTITMAKLDVILTTNPDSPTENILAGTVTDIGQAEYGEEFPFNDMSEDGDSKYLYVYNNASADAYVRIKLDSDYDSYIELSVMAENGYDWRKSGDYYYLSEDGTGSRISLEAGEYACFAVGYILSNLPNESIDADGKFTFYFVLEAVQSDNINDAGLDSVGWTDRPTSDDAYSEAW